MGKTTPTSEFSKIEAAYAALCTAQEAVLLTGQKQGEHGVTFFTNFQKAKSLLESFLDNLNSERAALEEASKQMIAQSKRPLIEVPGRE